MIPTPDQIEQLDYSQLHSVWEQIGLPPRRTRIGMDLMRRLIADAAQRQTHHNCVSEARISRKLKQSIASGCDQQPTIQPGTVLTRDWKGKRHIVHVSDDGFEWQGERYRSLSRIAYLITGTRWSGPRFFGVSI